MARCRRARPAWLARAVRPLQLSLPAGILAFSAIALAQSACAQNPADFYRGKSLELYICSSVGGGYDAYARMLARHIGRFIPGNPTVVAKNMEGAGGLRLANFLYNAAPKDATAIATVYRGIPFDPLLGGKGAQFDATRFTYIGSANNEVSVCVVWHTTGVTRFEDALTRTLVVGASGPSADSYQFPKIVNGVLGSKFKIITGYPGGNDIDLAMERGEVQGRCSWSWTSLQATRRSWLADKKINLLFQMGLSKHPDLPDVPLVVDLAKREEDRAVLELVFARQVMAWPYLAPPGIPPDRADALRRAFMQTMNDADFLADAEKSRLEVRPVAGEDIEKLVRRAYGTPAAIAERAASLLK
jgi:tripartite-type tricarboxylate transporter receptor subunit TctC